MSRSFFTDSKKFKLKNRYNKAYSRRVFMEIGLMQLGGGTPVFYVESLSSVWGRVFGSTPHKATQRWYFPAFHPFLYRVLADFKVVAPEVQFSTAALTWTQQGLAGPKVPDIPSNYTHQNEGLKLLLENYRFILNWEMGTGKSKVIVDLVNELKELTLILCPLVGVKNWKNEFKKHVGDDLSCLTLSASRKKKLEGLKEAAEHDVVVVPYDTASLYGLPMLSRAALTAAKDSPFPIPKDDLDLVRQINDPETQVQYISDILKGRTRADLRAEVAELKQEVQWLTQLPYKIIVADESHRIKRIQSRRTKVCMELANQATRRYLLSGTLSQGDPRDLYSQLKFLAPYLIAEDFYAFQKKHVAFSPWNKHVVTGYMNLHMINSVVSGVSSVKKLNECVDLPEQQIIDIPFDLYMEQVRDYNYGVKEGGLDTPDGDLEFANGGVRVAKLLEICSGFYYAPPDKSVCDICSSKMSCVEANIQPGQKRCSRAGQLPRKTFRYQNNAKLDTLEDLLEDLFENPKEKVLIWAYYEAEMDDIEALLKSKKLKYLRVDGKNSNKATEIAEKFCADPSYSVYLGQISTGIMINLVAAKYSIYYSRSWKLDDWLQSLKRNHRIGQNEKTVAYRLVASHSIEQNQIYMLDLRLDIAHLLTERTNCLTCKRYKDCHQKGVRPWDATCKLEISVLKGVTKPKEIK
jgi:SNF2 family DNA or RNA helicase